ncbi:MAG TPA: HEAT repeat domain-containing protein [Longimicrobium sp.]|jgi:hypothetical protein|nr:HEAT repeat domain-containing protein [Longimicrobium sp.]
MAPTAAPSTDRVALSRDLASFLIDFAIALQNHAVYPAGHPFLARSADAVIGRLDGLLLDRGSLSFGVARDRLVIEGVATEPENPVLSGLAGRLHRHRVGAVTLSRGLAAAEVEAVLGALAVEAELGGALMAGGARPEWPNVRLHPLSFGDLELADGGGEPGEAGSASARAPQLWIGLARAALASAADADDAAPTPEPVAVARAIEQHGQQAAYDQVIVGYLLQLADELRAGGGHGALEVRRRLSRMILALKPSTLRRLVEMGGDLAQRRTFVLDASHGFAADAVVRLVEAAAAASQRTVSDSLLRLLTKLAAHADRSTGPGRVAADVAMREQVARLVEGWDLPNPNPEGYEHALDALARGDDAAAGARGPATPEPERMVQTALEVDAGGPMAWAAVRELASGDRLHELIALLEDAPAESRLAGKVWEQVTVPECARALLRAGPAAAPALDLLCARLGKAAVPALLDELVESENRGVRRAALARLAAMGPAAAAEAQRRLDDPRWYVARNLLGLLGQLGAAPEPAVLARLLRHPDERVRREAFKLAFPLAEERPRALSLGLVDADPQVLRLALAECQRGCPAAALPLVCRRIGDPALEPELRVLAVRALGASREPLALRTLVRLADGGRSLLGRRRLAAGSAELVAAVAALAAGWSADADAAAVLALARKSADAQLRVAVEGRPA